MKYTKSAVMGIAALTTALALSACSTYDRAASYVTEPVVKDVKVGMTKQQVVDIAGQPATSITMVNARGTCSTYLISGTDKNHKTILLVLMIPERFSIRAISLALNMTPILKNKSR